MQWRGSEVDCARWGGGGGQRFVAVVSVSKVVIAAVQNQMQVSAG